MYGSHTRAISTADMTRVWMPRRSRKCWSARLLMTVASMPMWSAATRSMPRPLAASPRKLFPPPTTIPICTPIACTTRISSASLPMTCASMPWPRSPARISPLSFNRSRWYGAAKALVLAEPETREAPHDDVLPGLGGRLLDDLGDRMFVVADVRLLEQAHLGEELVDLSVDDLLEDIGRLAA